MHHQRPSLRSFFQRGASVRQATAVWLVVLFVGLAAVETAVAEDISGIISTTKFHRRQQVGWGRDMHHHN
jgi:hypothetical protein